MANPINGHRRSVLSDPRIVCGARCTWWDSIAKVANNGLPCCPHCGGVLFEFADEAIWWIKVREFEAQGHPGYTKFIEWCRGQCHTSQSEALAAYRATGGEVTL